MFHVSDLGDVLPGKGGLYGDEQGTRRKGSSGDHLAAAHLRLQLRRRCRCRCRWPNSGERIADTAAAQEGGKNVGKLHDCVWYCCVWLLAENVYGKRENTNNSMACLSSIVDWCRGWMDGWMDGWMMDRNAERVDGERISNGTPYKHYYY